MGILRRVVAAARPGPRRGRRDPGREEVRRHLPGPVDCLHRRRRVQGVSAGDRLRVVAGERTIAELEVVSVAERWASCRTISRTRPIATGDVVVPLVPTRVAAASPTPAPTPTPHRPGPHRRRQPSPTRTDADADACGHSGSAPTPTPSRHRHPTPTPTAAPAAVRPPGRACAVPGSRDGPLLASRRRSRRSPPRPRLRRTGFASRACGRGDRAIVQGQVPLGRERLPRRGPGAGSPSGRPARGRGRDGRRRARGRLRGRAVGLVQAALGEAPGAAGRRRPAHLARPGPARAAVRDGVAAAPAAPSTTSLAAAAPAAASTPGPPARGPACAAAPRSATTRPGTRRSRTTTSRSARGGWTSGSTTSAASR